MVDVNVSLSLGRYDLLTCDKSCVHSTANSVLKNYCTNMYFTPSAVYWGWISPGFDMDVAKISPSPWRSIANYLMRRRERVCGQNKEEGQFGFVCVDAVKRNCTKKLLNPKNDGENNCKPNYWGFTMKQLGPLRKDGWTFYCTQRPRDLLYITYIVSQYKKVTFVALHGEKDK